MIDPEEEPDGDALAPHHFWVGVAVAVFSFGSVWRYYPTLGAVGSLIGLLIALDDAVEHAFNVPTPLDMIWVRYIAPIVRRIER